MLDTRLESILEEDAFVSADCGVLRDLQGGVDRNAWTERELWRWLAAPGVEARVPRERAAHGPPIAFFVLHSPPNGVLGDVYLANLGVVRAWRRRGVGTFALHLIEERARRRGSRRIVLHVEEGNLAAQCLYRSMGYRVVQIERAGYVDEDAYRMVHELGGTKAADSARRPG